MKQPNRHPLLKIFRIMLGVIFLVLGALGLFLPFLQGLLFLLLGVLLLAIDIRLFRSGLYALKKKLPFIHHPLRQARKKLQKLFSNTRNPRGEHGRQPYERD